jgi:protein-S-isoprenylcysteine O-methyltransferase Ste14
VRGAPGGTSDRLLLFRALLAFLLLPGVVAYVVPLLGAPRQGAGAAWRWIGIALVTAGSSLLVLCTREFLVAGRGTLAPWSPPERLVSSGPYRWSRNPMYVAVGVVLLGWAACFASRRLAFYALAVLVAFHLRVVLYEEPRLASLFGTEWRRYRACVRRWL